MSSIHETAYPRFKPSLTEKELDEIYTPSDKELDFTYQHCRLSMDRLLLLLWIKTGQRLGNFVHPSDIPGDIVAHIAKCAKVGNYYKNKVRRLAKTGSGQRLRDLARDYLNLKALNSDYEDHVSCIGEDAAQVKQELSDIINVIVEELVRQRIELPGFTVLLRAARRARSTANDRLYKSICVLLSNKLRANLDTLLEVGDHAKKMD